MIKSGKLCYQISTTNQIKTQNIFDNTKNETNSIQILSS